MNRMTKSTAMFTFLTIILFFTSLPAVYGAGGAEWWDLDSTIKNGRVWKGVLSINFQVVDVSSQPDRLYPGSSGPTELPLNDVRVQATFTARVQSTAKGQTDTVSFSGIATYEDGGQVYNHFWLVADASLITMAFSQFLDSKIFSDQSSSLHNGAFTWADPEPSQQFNSNVIAQITGSLVPGEPLYAIVGIEIQTPN